MTKKLSSKRDNNKSQGFDQANDPATPNQKRNNDTLAVLSIVFI